MATTVTYRIANASIDELPSQSPPVLNRLSAIVGRQLASFEECLDWMTNATDKDWAIILSEKNDLRQLVDNEGQSFLMCALKVHNTRLAQNLIKDQIYDPLLQDTRGNTPLHLAAQIGERELIEPLLRFIDMNASNRHHKKPLHKAIKAGQVEATQALANAGNILAPFVYKGLKINSLQYAVIRGEIECFDILAEQVLQKRDPLNQNLPSIGSLLHLAVHFQQNQMLDHLLKTYPEQTKPLLECRDEQGHTPLAYAILVENPEAVAILQVRGADIETANAQGWRPIHLAVQKENPFFFEFLISLGCNLNALDTNGLAPISVALDIHKPWLKNLMSKANTVQDRPPHYGYAPPQNLVFKGGGPKGIAYFGVLKALDQKGALSGVTRVAGTSAGAINSALLACNFSLEETERLLRDTDLKTFLDHPFTAQKLTEKIKQIPSVANALRAFKALKKAVANPASLIIDPIKNIFSAAWHCTGACEGEVFRNWIEKLIQSKTGIAHCTFGELRKLVYERKGFRHLHVFATGLNPRAIVHFNSEDPQWDHVIISDAVKASMSIPAVFIPHTIHKKINGARVRCNELGAFADGGMLYNLPIEAFDERQYIQHGVPEADKRCPMFNKRTLGFSLYSPEPTKEAPPKAPETVGDLFKGLFFLYTSAEDLLRQRNPYNQQRIIEISNEGVGTLDFSLSEERKKKLIDSGEKATLEFYEKHSAENSASSLFYYPRLQKQIRRALSLRQPNLSFTGRQTELATVGQILKEKNSAVLYGPSGIGKTELAITYANKNLDNYSLVWVIPCSSEQEKMTAYIDLADALKIPFQQKQRPEDLFHLVHSKLENLQGKPWLLIYDNFSSTKDTPTLEHPQRGGHVLITSHAKGLSKDSVEMKPFSLLEAQELMTKLTNEPVSQEMNKLITLCGCYPFILERVGMDIRRTPGASIKTHLVSLSDSTNIKTLPATDAYRTTLEHAILQTTNHLPPKAVEWLQLCYYLHPSAIPQTYLQRWLKMEEGDIDPRSQSDILISLSEHAIQKFEEGFLSMPPVFHKALKLLQTPPQTARDIQLVHQLLVEDAMRWSSQTQGNWEERMKYASLWSEHAAHFSKRPEFKELAPDKQAIILHFLGVLCEEQSELKKAILYYKQAIPLRQGEAQANTLSTIGDCCIRLNQSERAAKYFQRAEQTRKQSGTQNPLDQAQSLLDRAATLQAEGGRGAEALSLSAQALQIQMQITGESSIEVARTLYNMGLAENAEGSRSKALAHFKKAHSIATKLLNTTDPFFKKIERILERLTKLETKEPQ